MTMRKSANLSLVVLASLFVIILFIQLTYGKTWWNQALLFIVEAGMVGALADWFAVTALFRHPLGLKWIPHTAIIAKNRNKLVEGVVSLVEEQLLDKQSIKRQLTKFEFVPLLVKALGQQPLEKLNDDKIKKWLAQTLNDLIKDKQIENVEKKILHILNEQPLSKWLGTALMAIKRNKLDQKLIEELLSLAEQRLIKPDILPWLKQILEEEAKKLTNGQNGGWLARLLYSFAEATNAVNLDDAAKVIYQDLLKLTKELKDEQHELRRLLDEHLVTLSKQLQEDEQASEVIRRWAIAFIAQLDLPSWLPDWMKRVFSIHADGTASKPLELLYKYIKKWLHLLWTWFANNTQAQRKLEEHLHSFLTYLIEHEYKLVGQIVRGTLDSFSEQRLIEFIESKVEVDLQRIRLNGALIGSAVGALLYGLLYGIYTPLLELINI